MARGLEQLSGFPPGPSGSTMAGMRWFGVIARKSGLNWSPFADVDRDDLVWQRQLLQGDMYLVPVRRRPGPNLDHCCLPSLVDYP